MKHKTKVKVGSKQRRIDIVTRIIVGSHQLRGALRFNSCEMVR